MEEARLKARKEQLELEAKIAASHAKIKVCADYEDGQDAMNEYYELECMHRAGLKDTFHVKDEEEETCSPASFHATMSKQQPAQAANAALSASTHGAASSAAPTDHLQQAATPDGICKIIQHQNEITEMLGKQHHVS